MRLIGNTRRLNAHTPLSTFVFHPFPLCFPRSHNNTESSTDDSSVMKGKSAEELEINSFGFCFIISKNFAIATPISRLSSDCERETYIPPLEWGLQAAILRSSQSELRASQRCGETTTTTTEINFVFFREPVVIVASHTVKIDHGTENWDDWGRRFALLSPAAVIVVENIFNKQAAKGWGCGLKWGLNGKRSWTQWISYCAEICDDVSANLIDEREKGYPFKTRTRVIEILQISFLLIEIKL